MVKISIIIPVYNVEKYLREALDSVLNQTYTNWEAICVNDGSTDSSLRILEEYAQKDSRFVVVNQENGGVSRARNTGLNMMTGEYIMFLDSDDYLESCACEEALDSILKNNVDICIFGYQQLVNNELVKSYRSKQIEKIVTENIEPDYTIFLFLWSKIYSADFIKKNNLRFEEDQHTAEDTIFMYETVFNNATHCFLNKQLYVYRVNRENSLTTLNIKGIKSDLQAAKRLCNKTCYKVQPLGVKKNIAKMWFLACFYYYNKFNKIYEHIILYFDIIKTVKFWEKELGKNALNDIVEYKELRMLYRKIVQDIFPKKNYSDNFPEYLVEINFEKNFKKLKRKLKNKKIVLYGTGAFFEYIVENFSFEGLDIVGISDMKFHESQEGEISHNYHIIPKSKILEYSPQCILVCAKNYEKIIADFNLLKNKHIYVVPLAKKC